MPCQAPLRRTSTPVDCFDVSSLKIDSATPRYLQSPESARKLEGTAIAQTCPLCYFPRTAKHASRVLMSGSEGGDATSFGGAMEFSRSSKFEVESHSVYCRERQSGDCVGRVDLGPHGAASMLNHPQGK